MRGGEDRQAGELLPPASLLLKQQLPVHAGAVQITMGCGMLAWAEQAHTGIACSGMEPRSHRQTKPASDPAPPHQDGLQAQRLRHLRVHHFVAAHRQGTAEGPRVSADGPSCAMQRVTCWKEAGRAQATILPNPAHFADSQR